MKNVALIFSLVLLVLPGVYTCSWATGHERNLRLYADPDLMEQEIERLVALGSPIEQAKGVMEASGFECRYNENNSFIRDRSSPFSSQTSPLREQGESIVYEGIDMLYCHLSELEWRSRPKKWQVMIAYEDRKVTVIAVSAHFRIVM